MVPSANKAKNPTSLLPFVGNQRQVMPKGLKCRTGINSCKKYWYNNKNVTTQTYSILTNINSDTCFYVYTHTNQDAGFRVHFEW